MIRKLFNKLKDSIAARPKYNKLFGHNNWEMTNYKYDRDWNMYKSDHEHNYYNISKSFEIKIINKNSTPAGHLNEKDMKLVSSDMNLYDWRLLYNFNRSLFYEMEKYINVNLLKLEIQLKETQYRHHLGDITGTHLSDPKIFTSNPLFNTRKSSQEILDDMLDYMFINTFIKNN